jgi:hypothetical protein
MFPWTDLMWGTLAHLGTLDVELRNWDANFTFTHTSSVRIALSSRKTVNS